MILTGVTPEVSDKIVIRDTVFTGKNRGQGGKSYEIHRFRSGKNKNEKYYDFL